jgi:hypothetical protein
MMSVGVPVRKPPASTASSMRGRLVVAASFGSRIAAICSVATPRQAGHETPPQRGAVRREQPAVLVGERLGNTALVESSLVRRQPRKEIFDPRLEPAVFEKRDRGSPALAQIGGHQCRPTACSRRGGRIAVLTRAPAVIIGLSRERGEKPSEIEAETRCPLATRAQTNSGFALWRCSRCSRCFKAAHQLAQLEHGSLREVFPVFPKSPWNTGEHRL